MRELGKINSLVIKIGSNILADSDKGINEARIKALAEAIASLRQNIPNISIVSSGAIAAGFKELGFKTRPKEITDKQACAAIGQSRLMWFYEQAFRSHNIKVAQILITKYDFSNRQRYLNAEATIKRLHSLGVIPIINENDVVVVNELKYVESFGDNDNLSALVAGLIDAELLLILSDVEGLYTADPSKDANAKLLTYIESINDDIMAMAAGSASGVGTGGMASKINAAAKAVNAGCAVIIANGKKPENISAVLSGKETGTYFKPLAKEAAKKRWLAHATIPKGSLVVDNGAQTALLDKHSSLLATGVTRVDGIFSEGDIVKVVNACGDDIAIGQVRYSSEELQKIKQKRSAEIEKILGRKEAAIVIHCDEMSII